MAITRPSSPDDPPTRWAADGLLLERVRKLSTILPAMAQDVAVARREAAQLRRENAALRDQLAERTP